MDIHLPINPQTHPKHWVSLCNHERVRFTTDFNEATCQDCIAFELDAVHNQTTDERGNPLFI